MADFGSQYGPYPEQWGNIQKRFFDSEPNTFRELYSGKEWGQLTNNFNKGWIQTHNSSGRKLSKREHEAARQRFYRLSGVQESSFDWEAYREYLQAVGSPSL